MFSMSTVTFENVCRAHTKRQVIIKMNKFNMFITAVCVLFLIKLRWPKNKSIYDTNFYKISPKETREK